MNEVVKLKAKKNGPGQTHGVEWRIPMVDQLTMRMGFACCKMHRRMSLVEETRTADYHGSPIYLITQLEKLVHALMGDFDGVRTVYRGAHVFFTEVTGIAT